MSKIKVMSLADASPDELRRWQMSLLDILVYFRDFCVSHNIKFYLAGGTRLGAIRHKGFIPWDDDVDVQLFREDYDRLLELWDKEADTSRFVCQVTTDRVNSRFPMATIRSVNTTCIYDHSVNDDICQGMKVDVEFLDVIPKSKVRRLFHIMFCSIFSLYSAQRMPRRTTLLKKIISKILLAAIPSHTIRWKIAKWCEKQIKRYNPGNDNDLLSYLMVADYHKEWFKDTVWVDFEGYKMPVPIGYEEILKAQYGDYMQLPPEDKRISDVDNLVFYDLDHSYLDYKGKYYCLD